jgi:hypothetical protein
MTVHEKELPFHLENDTSKTVIANCNNQGCPGIVEYTVKPVWKDSKKNMLVVQH